MFLVRTRVRSGKSFKVYTRLVESYRRPDGMPAQRVIANLGEMSELEFQNLKLALKASKQGRSVVLRDAPSWRSRITANLAYLDVAVALEMWRSWGLSGLLERLIPERKAAVGAADVVCALTMQRCVAPGSKLAAGRWFGRTALPELLAVEPEQFHNTRVHRVLDALDRVEGELQESLAKRYQYRDGAFATLFVDVSDAWFEGRGPDMAERARTKEGLRNRHKVAILLLCNERGYPVRWKTLPGRTKDHQALGELVEEIEAEPWVSGVPIVFDRAMGRAGSVARLWASGLRFVTAVARTEIRSYTDALPAEAFEQIAGADDDAERERQVAEAGRIAEAVGMQKVDERLYVLDLGVAGRRLRLESGGPGAEDEAEPEGLGSGPKWLARARKYRRLLAERQYGSQAELARQQGVSRARMSQVMALLRLDEELQRQVLAGRYGSISEVKLRQIAKLRTKAAQRRALADHSGGGRRPGRDRAAPKARVVEAKLRRVLYFNPQMLVDQRAVATRQRQEVEALIADLNRRLARRTKQATVDEVLAEVHGILASRSMLSVYDVRLSERTRKGRPHLAVELVLNEQAWSKRRSCDGFVLLVAHPDLPHSAAELVALYRAKDAVEKDFQTIESDLKLRPVFHRTDPKVRAHVTVCMLALLLERTLEQRLAQAGRPMSAGGFFELMSSVHLNLVATEPDQPPLSMATEADVEQRKLLELLGLDHLIDETERASHITARSAR